jgi:nitrate reductase gamma subunit
MYEFTRGPLVWIAFLVFFGGGLYRFISTIRLAREEKVLYPYMSLKYGFRSIVHWIIPYGSLNMRREWAYTFLSYAFHVGVILTPIFLAGHVLSWEESWGVSWWSFPGWLTTALTVTVVSVGIIFALRRIANPAVRYVTYWTDYAILALILAPFVTGLLAYYQIFDYHTVIILHIWAGALFLILIPFTRLVHMLFFPLTRAYMGSESGAVRNSRDW